MSPFRIPEPVLPPQSYDPVWPGWPGIRHMFQFGDSYTRTGFRLEGVQPSPDSPLGNPPYPGKTSANGPNWLGFLTTTWNESYIETINFSRGGAVVDKELVPRGSTVQAFRNQVEELYQPKYSSHPAFFNWRPQSTLFGIWIGFNDIVNARSHDHGGLIFQEIFESYARLVEQLYQTGARNFLFLNLPPVDLTPMIRAWGGTKGPTVHADVAGWNQNLTLLINRLEEAHPDVTTFTMDTHKLFTDVLHDPSIYEETRPYEVMTGYCRAYEGYTKDWYKNVTSCEHPVDKYFWVNKAHPGFRMHNLTAREIARNLTHEQLHPRPGFGTKWFGWGR